MDGVSTLSRRRLLAGVAAGVTALAGCGGTNAQNRQANGAANLGYVRVTNRHDAAHTVHVLVERDDEVVFWSSYDLPAADDGASPTPVEGPWTEAVDAAYTMHFRVDERDEWKTFRTDGTDADCYGLEARVEGGELGLWTEQQLNVCEESTATE